MLLGMKIGRSDPGPGRIGGQLRSDKGQGHPGPGPKPGQIRSDKGQGSGGGTRGRSDAPTLHLVAREANSRTGTLLSGH